MTINLSMPQQPTELRPKIIVFGVGGAGCNAVNNMIRSNIEGVECVVANTDAQALTQSSCQRQIQLGMNITQGLGAGSRPEIGRAAAEEGLEEIITQLQGGHMVFITAGMGGGTGTGAAPVIARTAREHGILTVGVVTKPFHFEGAHRMKLAEAGLQELQEVVDTLIVIPNQNLFRIANEKTTFADAFKMADEVLHSGVRGITDLMVMPGLINLDFADIRTVMSEMGKAMMGAGEADGDNRAVDAAEAAISNPLLDDVSMAGARGLLINISGGSDLTLYEVDEAANRVRDEVDPGANIIFGSTFDESLDGRMRVSVFATGIDSEALARPVDAEVRIMKPAKPQFLEADPLENLTKERPQPEEAPRPAAQARPIAPVEPEPAPAARASEETADTAETAEAPAPAEDPDPNQTDMFNRATPADDSRIVEAPMPAPVPEPQPRPQASTTDARRRSLALKVIPRDEDANDGGSDDAGHGGNRKEAVLGFFRNLKKGTGPEANDRGEVDEAERSTRPLEQKEPVRPVERPAAPAPAPAARDASAPEPQERRDQRPLVQDPPARTAAKTAEQDDDLLEIPAFLRRQAN
jgi:cell division protein FtsZ